MWALDTALTVAVRSVFHRPGFAAAAILLLALGAGANAAVFSVVRGILLRPLPYRQPDRLVAVWPGEFVSNRDIGYFRERLRSFEQVAGISPGWMMALVAEGGEPLKVTGGRVSDNMFVTLGVEAALGRTIRPGEGRSHVAVLAFPLWQTRFSGDPAVLGKTIVLDQQPHAVIGVMPRGFEIFEPGHDVWVPFPYDPASPIHAAGFSQSLARLRPGVTVDAASREIAALAPAMRRDLSYPDDWGQTLQVGSLQEAVVGNVRPMLLILLGAVGLILLLAAVNLGTLVLGRAVARTQEMAVRTALGASRGRLLRQLLLEQAVLAVLGALAGIALAGVMLPALVSRIPPEMPRVGEVALDGLVFVTVLGVSIGVALLMALVPAALASRPSLQLLLRQAHSTDTRGRRRTLGALVAAQVALAVVLGIGAGLTLRSLWNLQRVDPGFAADGVLSFRLQTTSKYRELENGLPYFDQVVERVRALPGVISVGSIQHLPMTGYSWTTKMGIEGQPIEPRVSPPTVAWRFVGWDYFATMKIPLRAGRLFTNRDGETAPLVAIVNQTLARKHFRDPSTAVGRRVILTFGSREQRVEIVGIVGDVRHKGLGNAPEAELYRPLAQTFMFPMAFVVRTAGPPRQLAADIRQAVHAVDPTIPVAELQSLSTLLSSSLGRPRLLAQLLSVFASVGLLLGVVGVYGVVAYRVRQREREIGVRLALGAAPAGIVRLIVRQGAGFALAGLGLGLPAALVLAHVMQSVVFGIGARDPLTFITLPTLVLAATVAACYLPARRAARLDPALTMKE